MSNARVLAICFLLALMQGLCMVGAQYQLTGALSLPLDDSFIHLQYGKQLARGFYFQYQDIDSVTGGATSFLYPHLLAIGWRIGFIGDGLIVWAHLISLVSVTAIFFFLIQCGRALSCLWAGWGAALLTAISGHMAWAFWSGMEISLFTALFLAVMAEAFYYQRLTMRLGILSGILALSRPEGLILSLVIGFTVLIMTLLRDRTFIPALKSAWPGLVFYGACAATPLIFYRLSIGRWGGNSLMAKSLLYSPIQSLSERLSGIAENAVKIAWFLNGSTSHVPRVGEFVFPGLLVFALIGFIAFAVSGQKARRNAALITAAPVMIVLAAVATLEVWSLHNFRYLAPLIPWLTFWALCGFDRLLEAGRLHSAALSSMLIAVLVLLNLLYTPNWASRYAHESAVIYEKQRAVAEWISSRHPDLNRIAINDAGALAYYSSVPIYDLVGLVTNDTTLAYRLGEGALYERIQRVPKDERPRLAVIFPSWFEEMSRTFDVFYRPQALFPDPFDPGFGKTVYEINWFYSGNETKPREKTIQPGWQVVDSLDVADIVDEQKHNYEIELRDSAYPEIPSPFRRNFGYHEEIDERWPGIENEVEELIPMLWETGEIYDYDILDAGRRINGSEQFTLDGLKPNETAWLIMRTCENEGSEAGFSYRMAVEVNGLYAGEWTVSGSSWNWYETVFEIHPEFIEDTSIEIRIRNIGTDRFPFYDSYYYWICQSEPEA